MKNQVHLVSAQLCCLYIIWPLGKAKFSSDNYIMDIYLSLAELKFCYFYTSGYRQLVTSNFCMNFFYFNFFRKQYSNSALTISRPTEFTIKV